MSSFQEPASHSYLGDNLEDIKNRSILECNEIYEVLLIPMNDVILFPNETLPLRIQNPNYVTQIRKLFDVKSDIYGQVKDEIHHLGILSFCASRSGVRVATFGTTMEVRTKSKETLQTVGNNDEIILTGKGRHRFKVLSTRRVDNVTFGKVQILRDDFPTNGRLLKNKKAFPQWVYECNQPSALALEAYKLFTNSLVLQDTAHEQIVRLWGPVTAPESTPSSSSNSSGAVRPAVRPFFGAELDPVSFSFFLAANLPIANEALQRLLEAPNVLERLRLGIHLLKENSQKLLGCGNCRQPLATKREVFSLPGAEGMVGAYVNPHGAVHQTVTIRRLVSGHPIQLEGRPTAKDSWFPDYAWTIAYCGRCYNHLGWKFTIVTTGSNETSGGGGGAVSGNDSGSDSSGDDMDSSDEESANDEYSIDGRSDEEDAEGGDGEGEGEDDGSYEMSYEGDRDPLDSSDESSVDDHDSTGDDGMEQTSPTVEGSIREDGRVTEFWGLRRAALMEV